ncbi:hypothetical protein ACFL0L_04580 [Patescibacteria group bacterium]
MRAVSLRYFIAFLALVIAGLILFFHGSNVQRDISQINERIQAHSELPQFNTTIDE